LNDSKDLDTLIRLLLLAKTTQLLDTTSVNDELVLSNKNLLDEDFHHGTQWPAVLI
jgi:hypothetical protein